MKHSPLPWKIDKGDELWILSSEESECVEGGYIPVAQPIEEYDAEFIVEACNNYEALENNHQNLLAEHQEALAIIQEQRNTIQQLEARNDILAKFLAGIMTVFLKHRSTILKMSEELKNELINMIDKAEKYLESLEGKKPAD